ncbi:hypothetical protein D7267_04395 [Legionella pneumophila]|nr:hypothetical protein D7267_04395 [Legionella pneumophila]RYX29622.1 hypothetical protein D8B28_05560 [Legionella pneumophila]
MKNFLCNMRSLSLLLIISSLPKFAIGEVSSSESQNEPPNLGNFALPTSQQPGLFFLLANLSLIKIRYNFTFHQTICIIKMKII